MTGARQDFSKNVLVDFDGTLMPFSFPRELPPPFPGVKEALRRIRAAGFKVMIFSSRTWSGWGAADTTKQRLEMVRWLTKHAIPYDGIVSEKAPAVWMIDDRAVPAPGSSLSEQTWEELANMIVGSEDDYGKADDHRTRGAGDASRSDKRA